MHKIAVCDDEAYFRKHVGRTVEEYLDENDISGEVVHFSSGEELISLKNDIRNYDIIFLDINMEGIGGMEAAKQIRKIAPDIFLIFVTGMLAYSLDGYKVEAFRYLLKDEIPLKKSIYECMDAVQDKINQLRNKIPFQFLEGQQHISLDQIIYIESNLHKLTFYIESREVAVFTMYEKLDNVENLINSNTFCRIHKSFLVNLKYVTYVDRYKANLRNGIVLNIAKPRFGIVKNQYVSYIMND